MHQRTKLHAVTTVCTCIEANEISHFVCIGNHHHIFQANEGKPKQQYAAMFRDISHLSPSEPYVIYQDRLDIAELPLYYLN